jgi:hypothetical protein
VTYDPIPYAQAAAAPVIENDRRGALIGFGVGSIIIGALWGCGALGLVMAVAMSLGFSGTLGVQFTELALAIAMYAAAATLFIWVGVDSIRCRRWVRPVVIAVGWITIASVSFGLAFVLVGLKDLPILLSQSSQTTVTTTGSGGVAVSTVTPLSPADSAVPLAMALGFSLVMLVIAGTYVWFYSTAAVRRTLEAYNPKRSWTERCPLPVFVACAAMLLSAASTLMTAYQAVVPFFGTYVSGSAAIVLDVGAAGIMLVAMAMMYRMRRAGWWMAIGVIALGFTSAAITLMRHGAMEFYRRGHATAVELERLERSSVMNGRTPLVFVLVLGVLSVGYLVAVGRYFRGFEGAQVDDGSAPRASD